MYLFNGVKPVGVVKGGTYIIRTFNNMYVYAYLTNYIFNDKYTNRVEFVGVDGTYYIVGFDEFKRIIAHIANPFYCNPQFTPFLYKKPISLCL